ncbi:MAG: antitoxin [Phycisphaerae bacterium]|nr:antitoxin [Phycisphaerae bacterium]
MVTTKIFMNGRSQAVRLPKEFRFDAEEVCIARIDEMVVLYPCNAGWELLAEGIERFTDDFSADRNQPSQPDERKAL